MTIESATKDEAKIQSSDSVVMGESACLGDNKEEVAWSIWRKCFFMVPIGFFVVSMSLPNSTKISAVQRNTT